MLVGDSFAGASVGPNAQLSSMRELVYGEAIAGYKEGVQRAQASRQKPSMHRPSPHARSLVQAVTPHVTDDGHVHGPEKVW